MMACTASHQHSVRLHLRGRLAKGGNAGGDALQAGRVVQGGEQCGLLDLVNHFVIHEHRLGDVQAVHDAMLQRGIRREEKNEIRDWCKIKLCACVGSRKPEAARHDGVQGLQACAGRTVEEHWGEFRR